MWLAVATALLVSANVAAQSPSRAPLPDPWTPPGRLPGSCRAAIDPSSLGEPIDGLDPLSDEGPLAGLNPDHQSLAAISDLLLTLGLCHTFRFVYYFPDGSGNGYGESWCTAPPGTLGWISYAPDGSLVVFVEASRPMPLRQQPVNGWWHCGDTVNAVPSQSPGGRRTVGTFNTSLASLGRSR